MACSGASVDHIRGFKIEFFGVTPPCAEHVAPYGDLADDEDTWHGRLEQDSGSVQKVHRDMSGAPKEGERAGIEKTDQEEGENDETVRVTHAEVQQRLHTCRGQGVHQVLHPPEEESG